MFRYAGDCVTEIGYMYPLGLRCTDFNPLLENYPDTHCCASCILLASIYYDLGLEEPECKDHEWVLRERYVCVVFNEKLVKF